jgi:predicted molibdopterin-dependent oxidoreductase YjgC
MSESIRFTLDGRDVEARPGETIWQVAQREGIDIPHLCWLPEPGYRADGNCRACMVEIEGERVLAASCIRSPQPGMVVRTDSERARRARALVMELLVADQPPQAQAHDARSRFWHWAERVGVSESRFPRRHQPEPDWSHPAMVVQLDACIPNFLVQEHVTLGEGYLKEPFVVENGSIPLPTRPGLGIEVDDDAVAEKLYDGSWETPRLWHADGSVADW